MARRHPAIRASRRARRAGLAAALLALALLLAQLGSLAAWAETPGRGLTFDAALDGTAAPGESRDVPVAQSGGGPTPSPTLEPPSAAAPAPPCDARAGTPTTCSPKLTIAKVANVVGSQVAPGAPFTYTVTVANGGTATAGSVTISDALPSDLTGASASFSISGGPPQACAVAGNDVSCAVGALAQGASAVATISATAPRVCGDLSNVATVDSDQTKPLGSAPAVVTVAGCSLSIKKVATPSTVAAGGTLTYTIVVRNEDVAPASGVVVTDALPPGYAVASAEQDVDPAGSPGPSPCAVAGQTVTCSVGTLAAMNDASADDEAIVRIVATAPSTCGSAFNLATVHWGSGGQATSNSAKTTVAGCGLVIDKQGPASVALGGALSYVITVTNPNPSASQPVTVTDDVPAPLGNVHASAALNGAAVVPNPCAVTGNAVSCPVGVLDGGDILTVAIEATAPPTSCPILTNVANLVEGTGPGASSPSVTTTVTGCTPDVTLDKAGPGQVASGASIAYILTVTNSATADATNVVVTDSVPLPLSNVGAASSLGSCTVVGNDVVCSVGALAPGQDETITVTADVPLGACGVVDNAAAGAYDGGSLRSGTVQTSIGGCAPAAAPQLSLVKTADSAVVAPGRPLGFTLALRNEGAADAADVTINDAIPSVPGVAWSIDGGTAAGSCSLTGTALHCAIGALAAGELRTVHVSSTPTTTLSCGTYTNFAIAAAPNAPAARAQAAVEVACPPGIDLEKDGPGYAYVGDTVSYAFVVGLVAGSPALANVEVADPLCDPGTMHLVSKHGGDQDAILGTGETWRYRCTHAVTADDPDPLPNTATAIGISPDGDPVADNDDHLIDVRHPAIDLVKEADPGAGSPGASITYTYTVMNSGDVPLFDLSVDDDILGHVCDVRVLRPGETVVCVGTYTIPAGANVSITNIAIAGGTDPGERHVSDVDDETIHVVLGSTVTPVPTRTPPAGLAFTGNGLALALGAIGIALLVVGSGLLWIGHRLRRARRA